MDVKEWGHPVIFELSQDLIPAFQFSRGLRDFFVVGCIAFGPGAQGKQTIDTGVHKPSETLRNPFLVI
jgi:hypothetical protein